MRSDLLRGRDGAWRIATVWRDRSALMALREGGAPPAALALLDRLGVQHTHAVFTLEQSYADSPADWLLRRRGDRRVTG